MASEVFAVEHPEPMLRSVMDAAHLLGISPRYLRKLTSGGEISSIRIGKRVLYATTDLEEYISRKRLPGSESAN